MVRFSLKTIFITILVAAIGLAWWIDRRAISKKLQLAQIELDSTKASLWSERHRRREDASRQLTNEIEARAGYLRLADELVAAQSQYDPKRVAQNLRKAAGRALSLSDTFNTDEALEAYNTFTNQQLNMVHLSNSDVSDKGLRQLEVHRGIWFVDLHDCEHITDAAIPTLAALPQLRKVCILRTQITDAGAARLQQAIPNCTIIH